MSVCSNDKTCRFRIVVCLRKRIPRHSSYRSETIRENDQELGLIPDMNSVIIHSIEALKK